jgi:hypothetical protein
MISRRELLKLSTLVGLAPSLPALARDLAAPDYKIDIAPITLDLSPRHRLKTTAYNGQVPAGVGQAKCRARSRSDCQVTISAQHLA